MSCLSYHNNKLHIENVDLTEIAQTFGTPCYVYSNAKLKENWQTFEEAFVSLKHRICYAVKANGNITLLNLLAQSGAGFDIVSGGELTRVLKAGGHPSKIVFSGVGKSTSEIESALAKRVYCLNIESESELHRIQLIAERLGVIANISIRINPHINPQTHAHISTGLKENKFGIDFEELIPLCKRLNAWPNLNLIGIGCHIGSQITHIKPFELAIDKLIMCFTELRNLNINLEHLNIGGGLGICYTNEIPPSIVEYAQVVINKLKKFDIEVILEPGRALIANAGILLTRIEYIKYGSEKNFIITDAGMTDFLRVALYDANQTILPVLLHENESYYYDIAGPVCESSDYLGRHRKLAVHEGDLLAIDCAGAYGFSMSSNYNARPKPAEILIKDNHAALIRRRETIQDLMSHDVLSFEV